MKISQLSIKGFRNFKDAKFNFNNHTAIMGFNDIGKTNLIYALRLLLDRNISEAEMELDESDFFAFEETSKIEIIIKFDEIDEDFVLSKLKEKISDDGELFLKYEISKDDFQYKIYMGASLDLLEEIEGRYYLKAFNLKYIGSSRNLTSFIKKEKKYLLEKAKELRTDTEKEEDALTVERVETTLSTLNNDVREISYVKNATLQINDELSKLSYKNEDQNLVFDMASDDISSLLQKVDLSVSANDKLLAIGGDGRLNQIFIALWTNKHNVAPDDLSEISFYCIEEPEAHLHPHQQRKLSEYLAKELNNQVIITTHSPQIISEFKPNSIMKLHEKDKATYGANGGCSQEVEDELFKFAHRLDIISTEAFYSNLVFLVEGQSEILFYKALAKAIGIDIDRYNISILMVDGVGFEPYIRVLNLLQIPWIMRTDNDVFKIPRQEKYRFAGIQRGIKIYKTFINSTPLPNGLESDSIRIKSFETTASGEIPQDILSSSTKLISFLEEKNIYIANRDLENDLVYSEIFEKLKEFYGLEEQNEILEQMQKRKGGSMFEFLCKYQNDLTVLAENMVAKPLLKCKEIIEQL